MTITQASKQLDSLAHLCELATSENMYLNTHLRAFRPAWWEEMEQVGHQLDTLRTAEDWRQSQAETFDRAGEPYDTAAADRDAVFLADENTSDETKQTPDEEAARTRGEYRKVHEAWIEARRLHNERREHFEANVSKTLHLAAWNLVEDSHPRAWDADDWKSLPTALSRSPSQAAGHGENAELQEDPASPPQRSENHDSGDPQKPDGQPRQAGNFITAHHKEQNDNLERARAAYSAASKDFAVVRANCTRRLIAFLEVQHDDAAVGARADFDNRYFLARNTATRGWRAAKEAHRAALFGASKTRAFSVGMRVWIYGDEADRGRGRGGGRIGGVLTETLHEKVGRWREGTDEGTDEEILRGGRQEKMVLGAVEAWDAEQQRAEGRRRKLIDEWQGEQERIRESRGVPSEVIDRPAGAELQLYEAWNGI